MSGVLETVSAKPVERLDLFSVKRFEALLYRPIEEIEAIANKAGAYYSPFLQHPKRRWFPKKPISSKRRRIDNPSEPLKKLQKTILSRMLQRIDLPDHVNGGVKGRSLRHNIEMHMNSKVLVTLDVKSFFPSITSKQIYSLWRHHLNCSPKIAAFLTKLTTFERRLPQGAPTSTYLANLLIASIDHEIVSICKSRGVIYSTWVDDLAFSGSDARSVIQTVIEVLRQVGLAVSHNKLKVMGPSSRRILTGIVVGRNLNVTPEYRRDIRSGVHKLRVGQVDQAKFESFVKSMNGRIDHVSSFSPRLADELREEFGREVAATRKRFNIE
jgi:RNA-directed DNA polymerase